MKYWLAIIAILVIIYFAWPSKVSKPEEKSITIPKVEFVENQVAAGYSGYGYTGLSVPIWFELEFDPYSLRSVILKPGHCLIIFTEQMAVIIIPNGNIPDLDRIIQSDADLIDIFNTNAMAEIKLVKDIPKMELTAKEFKVVELTEEITEMVQPVRISPKYVFKQGEAVAMYRRAAFIGTPTILHSGEETSRPGMSIIVNPLYVGLLEFDDVKYEVIGEQPFFTERLIELLIKARNSNFSFKTLLEKDFEKMRQYSNVVRF